MDVASAAPQAYDTYVPKIYKLGGGVMIMSMCRGI